MRQESVLLRLVEAMNLVNKNNGPCAVLARPFSLSHDLLDFFYSREHRAEFDELCASHSRNDLRQRRLAGAGRPPENQRSKVIAFNLRPQRLARSNQVLLSDEFIERARTHAVGQRPRLVGLTFSARDGLK